MPEKKGWEWEKRKESLPGSCVICIHTRLSAAAAAADDDADAITIALHVVCINGNSVTIVTGADTNRTDGQTDRQTDGHCVCVRT